MSVKPTDLPTIPELTAQYVLAVITHTEDVTFFGENGVELAFAKATAEQTSQGQDLYRALLRRDTVIGAQGDDLTEVAEEHGTPRLGPTHARVLLILRPWSAVVTAVSGSMYAVDDSSKFTAGDSVRLTLSDGSMSEVVEVVSISTGTGPDGEDELELGVVIGSYDPTTQEVRVLLRKTKTAGTVATSTTGIAFEFLDDVTVGDANPVMLGESSALALADKVWAEAQEAGAAGIVENGTITRLQVEDPDIRAITNPQRSFAGEDEEADFTLKYRTTHGPQIGAQETQAQLEALARRGNRDVLRAFPEESDSISTIRIRVLTRNGGGLSTNARAALSSYMSQRLRSQLAVEVRNVETTSVEVEAEITLTPGTGTPAQRLEAVWRRCADKLATYLDWRKWPEAQLVDEAALLSIVRNTSGVATVTTSTFQPAADIEVPEASVPVFTRLVLTDISSSETFGADLQTSY